MTGAILVAFPVAESMRAFLREVSKAPLPSLYRTGAQNRPCSHCGMILNVGPRLLDVMSSDSAAVLVCPLCLKYLMKDRADDVAIQHLNNPESKIEGEHSS